MNIAPYERFFLLEVDQDDFNLVLIKDLIYIIIKKWSKCSKREQQPFCSYIYFHNNLEKQLVMLKKELYRENVNFIDGFPFWGADFYAETLSLPATHENKLQIKIINDMYMIDDVIEKIHQRVEIYQFYKKEMFYMGSDNVKHVKIQIEKLDNIKEII